MESNTKWLVDQLLPNVTILRKDVHLSINSTAMVSIANGQAVIFRNPFKDKPFHYVTMADYQKDPIGLMIEEKSMTSRTLFYYDFEKKTYIKTKAAERLLKEEDAIDIFNVLSQSFEPYDEVFDP